MQNVSLFSVGALLPEAIVRAVLLGVPRGGVRCRHSQAFRSVALPLIRLFRPYMRLVRPVVSTVHAVASVAYKLSAVQRMRIHCLAVVHSGLEKNCLTRR